MSDAMRGALLRVPQATATSFEGVHEGRPARPLQDVLAIEQVLQGGASIKAGLDEKIYPVFKIATITAALEAEGVSSTDALSGVRLSKSALSSAATRVSINQLIRSCCNAATLTRNSSFAYQTGLRFHVSTYGAYGFALLSSTDFRRTMTFWEKYRSLAAPLVDASFKEEGGRAIWTISPIALPQIDASLYRFLVELQFGTHVSLLRDLMGPSFAARELHVTYSASDGAHYHRKAFESRTLFDRPQNQLVFDAAWLDTVPRFGNEISYSWIAKLCDELLREMQIRVGVGGKVREVLLFNLMRPMGLETTAGKLGMSPRTLRRKLSEHGTSFRKLVDELRLHLAIKYLRDTKMAIEDIASALAFSDAANFRQAFRRWTQHSPQEFRDHSKYGH